MLRTSICLNGEWDFMPLYDQPRSRALPERLQYEARKIQVPSSWRYSYPTPSGSKFGEVADYDYTPFAVYGYPEEWNAAEAGVLHRMFQVPEAMLEQRVVLRLDGIMQKAAVYLDRERIAVWEDGYLPLRLDITPLIKPGREQHLHVVCGSFDQMVLPSGEEKITGLAGSWFGRIARGIWQDVFLEGYPQVSLEDLTIRTSVRQGMLEVDALIGSAEGGPPAESLQVFLRVRERNSGFPPAPGTQPLPVLEAEAEAEALPAQAGEGRQLCLNTSSREWKGARFTLPWQNARLWSPDTPFLYELELTLQSAGEVLDRRTDIFGFREFWCEGPKFMLNGIPVNLRGDSWHFQGAMQQTEDYIRNWYRLCRQAGINSIRLHAEPYPSDYLRIADEEGMLIVDETAIYGSGKTMDAAHPDFIGNCRAHVQRLVQRDKNHPSVILWSVQNEMRWVDGRDTYKQHIPGLMELMRALDSTRPIMVEGDNRLVTKQETEVESRHYNIDGTIAQWDREVPLTFGEHGGWWYICPQNSSMYIGLDAYRDSDASAVGLAEKERLFVEYARRQGVSGISTFNFAHYFMRAMPEQEIKLPPADLTTPGPKPTVIPAYSLSLNNGLLPEEYPAFRPNPSWAIMAAAFKPVTLIAAEYNRCFFDDSLIRRSFDVYNDTLAEQEVTIECTVRQAGRMVHSQTFRFLHEPAAHRTIRLEWMPDPVNGERIGVGVGVGEEAGAGVGEGTEVEVGAGVKAPAVVKALAGEGEAVLSARLFHGGELMHELNLSYRLLSGSYKTKPVEVALPAAYIGSDRDYQAIHALVPELVRAEPDAVEQLAGGTLLIVGSRMEDKDGALDRKLRGFVQRGGRLLLLEQLHLSPGRLPLVRREFIRAHAGDYGHPVLQGLEAEDLMYWHEELREEGPLPIIRAAFEKPVTGDFTLLLECSAGDFGDGGDLWSPLLEYRSCGTGMFLANQLEIMDHLHRIPQACLLLRSLLQYAGRAVHAAPLPAAPRSAGPATAATPAAALTPAAARSAAVWVRSGSAAEALLGKLRLKGQRLDSAAGLSSLNPGLLVVEAGLLHGPGAAEAVRQAALAGSTVLVLPAVPGGQEALARLLDRPVHIAPHGTYHLAADYTHAAVCGISPVDLFGFDKVHLSPRDVVNRELASHRLEVQGAEVLCTSVEGTAWKDYFAGQHTAEYSRLALVELNRRKATAPGAFVIRQAAGEGAIICSQLLADPGSDKSLRLYTRLLGNLGAVFTDELLLQDKGDAEWAVEAAMTLFCPPYTDYQAMKDYYTDPAFSLNNLGEGLYGWMKKKERREDGTLLIPAPEGRPLFLSCFVHLPETADADSLNPGGGRTGRLRVNSACDYEIYMNGRFVAEPEQEITLTSGINRLIAIVRGGREDIAFGMVFLNKDGTYMNDLEFRLTMDEVEPK
ncbi:glycoside hydrolase family 2 [Paenibacillus tritici]|uniref:glycoside hydrolase family 2 protein n=1 Tax=Paenibacillus tritici TaxID=1873425 RepID=UPI001BA81B65|nr:glycoside hydrolase family 2 TIM barrel-domain containing protein [Paenibacillus tritici]QUL54273.1 glycoside hydrolase family 2 [Paenibacillus tritici]